VPASALDVVEDDDDDFDIAIEAWCSLLESPTKVAIVVSRLIKRIGS
jgi:hypothetical protein